MVHALMTVTCDRRMERTRVNSRAQDERRLRRRFRERKGSVERSARRRRRSRRTEKKIDEEQKGSVYEYGITYVRPEHDAVIIVNRRGGESAGEMKRGGKKSERVFVSKAFI